MGILATDNFNRADSADLGASWDAGYTGANALQITGNKVRASVAAADCVESYNAVTLPDDQYGKLTLSTIGADAIYSNIILRASAPATQTFYRFAASNDSTVTSEIVKRVAGTDTQLATSTTTTWAVVDIQEARAIGTSVALYRNGTLVLSATDSAIASGRGGIMIFANVAAHCEVDDFEIGDFLMPPFRHRIQHMRM